MENEQLYKAIFHRKSIRKYDMAPLPATTIAEIQDFANSVKPLDDKVKYEFSYLSTADVKNILPIKAPHYICLYSEKQGNYLMNAGFVLQQIDLYLSANNLASCWLGMAKPSKEVPELKNGMEFVIMIAFGNSNEQIHREDTSTFNRHKLSEISQISGVDDMIEPVRLAPSASNTQPWFFTGNASEINVSREKLNILKAAMYGKMNQVDIGIGLCHLWLSLDHQDKSAAFDFNQSSAPKGYEFMVKVNVGRK
jgi:nitroreductase